MKADQFKFGINNLNNWFKNLKGGVLLASIVIILCFFLTIFIFNKSISETEAVDQTTEAQNNLDKIAADIKDIENGVHGFLLTGDSTYLKPYRESQDDLWLSFNTVYTIQKNNPAQRYMLDSLKHYLELRLISLNDLLMAKINKSQPEADSDMQKGKTYMFLAMDLIDQMKKNGDTFYKDRYDSAKSHLENARLLITLFLSISVIVAITSFYALTKSQREIAQREIRYRNLFDQNKEIIFTLNENLEVSDINRSVYEHLGFTQQEILSAGLFSRFTPAARDEIMRLIESHHRVDNYEVELWTKDDVKKMFLLNLIPTDKTVGSYQGSLYDINARVRLEEERVSLERYANVGKVSRVIAHEVRNPLANIQLAVEAIHGVSEKNEMNEYLRIIEKNAFRINNLVTELLSSTKLSEFNLMPVKINQLIDETLKAADDRIRLNDIKLIKSYDPEICTVMADEEKLKIALLNLVVNGIEAMENGGILKIGTKKTNDCCLVIIEDSGKGITPDDIKKIFQPFFSTKSNGTGLGLATSQNIILNHAGSIEVESIELKGTKFTVTLKLETN